MERKLPPMKALMAFEAVARQGDRAAAARELNVTPGAVSKQLRLLEDWAGVELVGERGLSAAGRSLAQSLSGGLDMISAGIAAARPPRGEAELAVLAPATIALRWLVPRLPTLGAESGARVLVRPTHTGEDWQALAHDVVLRRDGWVPPGYRAEPLAAERLTLAAAPSLVGPSGETPRAFVRRVPQLTAATRPSDAERWLLAADAGDTLGHRSRAFGHLYIACEAALAGEGWVLAPTIAIADDVARGRLATPFPHVTVGGPTIALLSRADRAAQERTAPVRAWLRSEVVNKRRTRTPPEFNLPR